MKTFEEYLDKMGYSWNDFDRTYEMENLIEQYADEKVKQALTIPRVVLQSEQLPKNNCTLNIQTCGKGSGCKYPHCHL